MITQVYGTVDGQDVIFERAGGDKWRLTVPFDRDGVYIVSLYADDDMGNTGFYATALLIITAAGTCVRLKMYPYRTEVLPDSYSAALLPGYRAELVHCDLCGRY